MGFTEMLVLGVIALLVIGPKQLPEVARVIGRTLNEFKRATGDLTSTFYSAKREAESYVNKTQNYMHQQKEEFEKSLSLSEDGDHGHHHDEDNHHHHNDYDLEDEMVHETHDHAENHGNEDHSDDHHHHDNTDESKESKS